MISLPMQLSPSLKVGHPSPRARFSAMGKEQFSIGIQVPPLEWIPAKVWDRCPNTKDG